MKTRIFNRESKQRVVNAQRKGSQASIVVVINADGNALLPVPLDYRPYHGPVRELVARTAFGIVREGLDDYTLYMRAPKAYLQALGVSKETFFEAEFEKLMVQCAMNE